MTLKEFENTVCSRSIKLSVPARETAQTILSHIRVAETEKQQMVVNREVLAELSSQFFIEADILVIRSKNAFAIVTPLQKRDKHTVWSELDIKLRIA